MCVFWLSSEYCLLQIECKCFSCDGCTTPWLFPVIDPGGHCSPRHAASPGKSSKEVGFLAVVMNSTFLYETSGWSLLNTSKSVRDAGSPCSSRIRTIAGGVSGVGLDSISDCPSLFQLSLEKGFVIFCWIGIWWFFGTTSFVTPHFLTVLELASCHLMNHTWTHRSR